MSQQVQNKVTTIILRFALVLAICFCFHTKAIGQYRPWDTVYHHVSTGKPAYILELDGRQSFFRETPVVIDGFRVGADFNNKIRLFIGAYWNRRPVERSFIINRYTLAERHITQKLSLFYVSGTLEYVLYNSKHWELAVPIQLGIGRGKRTRYDYFAGNEIETKTPFFVPFEFSFKARYRITDWLSVSAGLGYRYAMFSKVVGDDFSAPHYTYGIGISPIRILKRLGILEEKNGKLRFKDR